MVGGAFLYISADTAVRESGFARPRILRRSGYTFGISISSGFVYALFVNNIMAAMMILHILDNF